MCVLIPTAPRVSSWPLWKAGSALTSSSSSFSSSEVAVLLLSLSSHSWPTQAPCPCQDWKNPLFSHSHIFVSSRSPLALPSHPGAAKQSHGTATPTCPCHLQQCQASPAWVTSPCSAGPCGTGDGCPRCVPAVPGQSCARDAVTHIPSHARAQLCPQGAHLLLGFQCHLLLQPQGRTHPWSPHTWLCPLGCKARHQIPALVSPPGSSSTVAPPGIQSWGYKPICPFSIAFPRAFPWDTRTRAQLGVLASSCCSPDPSRRQSQEHLHPSLPPPMHPVPAGAVPVAEPKPQTAGPYLAGQLPFQVSRQPWGHRGPPSPGGSHGCAGTCRENGIWRREPHKPTETPQATGAGPCHHVPGPPHPFPAFPSPAPSSSASQCPRASPDSLLLLSAPSLSVSSTAKVTFPPRPCRAGGSCRLLPRTGCPLVLALLVLGKLLHVLVPALLLPAEIPGVLQECPGKAVATRSPRGEFLQPRAAWAEGDAQGTPQATPTWLWLRREILAPRDSRLSLLLRDGDPSCQGCLSSCARVSRLLPVGNKDSSCPG